MRLLAAALLIVASSAAAAECMPPDDPQSDRDAGCEQSVGRVPQDVDSSARNDDTRRVGPAGPRAGAARRDDDGALDDSEESCVTRAANGVCIDDGEQ